MQLKKINTRMGVAACALLQVATPAVQAEEAKWDVDTAVMYYSEGDGRIQAFEPGIYAGKEIGDDERIDLKAIVDVLTGASPNGAHASSSTAQTFTTPSGSNSYTAGIGETPQDDTFRDTRVALSADWTRPIDRLTKVIWGVNFSTEYDYLSLGASANVMRDFNNRNTTLTAGFGFNSDSIDAVGGTPIAFRPMLLGGISAINRLGSSETKTTTDFLVGVTQVLSRTTLMQLNLSMGMVDGYQNDPYKVLSVVDGVGNLDASGVSVVDPAALPYVYEKRPDSRQKNNLYFKIAHHLTEDVINFSYRYYWDDWDIVSHTLDMRYRTDLSERSYLQPHIRYYSQDAAGFYKHNLVQGADVDAGGNVLVNFASNDYRLAASETTTLGLKYGYSVSPDSEFSVRLEMINQTVDGSGVPIGEQTPDLDSLLLQVGYTLKW